MVMTAREKRERAALLRGERDAVRHEQQAAEAALRQEQRDVAAAARREARERQTTAQASWENTQQIISVAVLAVLVIGLIWLSVLVASWASNKGLWFYYLAGPIGFLFCLFVVYCYFKHLVTVKTYILLGTVIGASLFIGVGVMKFFLPTTFISPPANAALGDVRGQAIKGVCPVDGQVFPLGQMHCPIHLKALVFGDREALIKAGIDLDRSPFYRITHEPGEESAYVPSIHAGMTLPVKLKPGQKMKIGASGKVEDGATQETSGPKGIDPPLWLRDGRQYRCGGKWLALCVKVNPGPWQYCGKSCEIANPGNEDAFVAFSINEAIYDQNNTSHLEWWEDDSGGFAITHTTR